MMYSKLAFRNIRRSLRDYIIYFVTLTLTAALMYSFLALGFSPDILAMTENMSMLTTGIICMRFPMKRLKPCPCPIITTCGRFWGFPCVHEQQ